MLINLDQHASSKSGAVHSCINQFQIDQSTRLKNKIASGFLFDWAVVTPTSTIDVLKNKEPFILTVNDLELINKIPRSVDINGFYFWHMHKMLGIHNTTSITSFENYREGVDKFLSQHKYFIEKLNGSFDIVHCLWSNIQPDLEFNAQRVGISMHDFFLTEQKYNDIKKYSSTLNANEIKNWFVCRKEYVDASLIGENDVIVLDIPKSREYRGPVDLFDIVFQKMGF